MKINSVEIQAVFPTVVAEEPLKKRRRSSGSAPGKGTCTAHLKSEIVHTYSMLDWQCILISTNINNYRTGLSKILRFVSGELINYLPKPRTINCHDLRGTDKSQYFMITEFSNCFIV